MTIPVNKHVRHQGFDVELEIEQIISVLSSATYSQRRAVIDHLTPIAVKCAVANEFDIKIE
jgi:hypothetical protein